MRDIEKIYYAKEKRFSKHSKYLSSGGANLKRQEERDKLASELNSLQENLLRSEKDLWATLQEDGGWKARLISY